MPLGRATEHCHYCQIATGLQAVELVADDGDTITYLYGRPATVGHVVVFPKRHHDHLETVDAHDLTCVAQAAQSIARQLRSQLGATGINLLSNNGPDAWQLVAHFHLHVIPRYPGDLLRLPWDLEAADPADLRATAARLAGAAHPNAREADRPKEPQ